MKKVFTLMLLNLIFNNINSQNFDWGKREGFYAYDYGYGIVTDNAGNVYAAGKYEQAANFSGTILPCPDYGTGDCNHEIWVAQYSASGNLNWIRTGGGRLGDYAHDIACDNSFLYVAGEIEGTNAPITFPGSTVTLTCHSENDAFIAKYDLTGNLLWAKGAGWYQDDKALAVASDNSGNVIAGGFFNDTAHFDNFVLYGYGKNDIFVAKYDANGVCKWVQKAGSPTRDEVKSIKCDAAGNIYVTGMYSDGCVFGNQTLHCTIPGYFDIFLAKYDPDGNLLWLKTAGGDYDDVAWRIVIDNAGKIYMAGEYNAYATFGSIGLTTSGNADIFVACYDNSGNALWAKSAGGAYIERARGLGTDGTNLYLTGQFGFSASFGSTTLTAPDSSDIFIARMDNNGNFSWAVSVGGPADNAEPLGYECGNAVCADASSGKVYATGSQLTNASYGNGPLLKNYDRTDVFLTGLTQPNVNAAEINNTKSILIYPNPGNGNFTLATNRLPGQKFEITIQNYLGQVIEKISGSPSKAVNIDLSSQEKGIYFMEVKTEDQKVYREKIVLQ